MIRLFYDLLFGCWHGRLSVPITLRTGHGEPSRTYVVCLNCGKEFPYDWTRMKTGRAA